MRKSQKIPWSHIKASGDSFCVFICIYARKSLKILLAQVDGHERAQAIAARKFVRTHAKNFFQ